MSKYAHDGVVPHLSELRKWYEFDVVKRLIKPWVKPGPDVQDYLLGTGVEGVRDAWGFRYASRLPRPDRR